MTKTERRLQMEQVEEAVQRYQNEPTDKDMRLIINNTLQICWKQYKEPWCKIFSKDEFEQEFRICVWKLINNYWTDTKSFMKRVQTGWFWHLCTTARNVNKAEELWQKGIKTAKEIESDRIYYVGKQIRAKRGAE